jgi:amino acid transporter
LSPWWNTLPLCSGVFLLAGLSLFVLRVKESEVTRPFRVPLYPFTPFFFCMTCVYMLQSSVAYTGVKAFARLAVLLAGVPLLLLTVGRHEEGKEKGTQTYG